MNEISWPQACEVFECPGLRVFMTPLCKEHLLDAWRWVEMHPDMKPAVPPEVRRRAARGMLPDPPTVPVVYYLRRANGGVKIGTTAKLVARIATLREPWPDAVLAVEPGDRVREAERHAQFAAHRRYRGANASEEFDAVPALMAHIDEIRKAHGDPEAFAVEQARIFADWRAEQRRALLARAPGQAGDRAKDAAETRGA